MTTDRNQKIQALIEQISDSARLAEELSLDDTTRLIAMTLLDLRTKLHSISPDELRSFTRTVANVVEFKVAAPANDTNRVETGKGGQKGQRPVVG